MRLNLYIYICKANHQPSSMTYHKMAKQLPSHFGQGPSLQGQGPHVVRYIHHKSLRQPRPSEKKPCYLSLLSLNVNYQEHHFWFCKIPTKKVRDLNVSSFFMIKSKRSTIFRWFNT